MHAFSPVRGGEGGFHLSGDENIVVLNECGLVGGRRRGSSFLLNADGRRPLRSRPLLLSSPLHLPTRSRLYLCPGTHQTDKVEGCAC